MIAGKILSRALFLCFSVMALHACAAVSGKEVSSQELTSLISGNTVYGINSAGQPFIQIFSADGSLQSGRRDRRDDSGKWVPTELGRWEVVDGRLCNKYTEPQVRDGGCDRFYRGKDGTYRYVTSRGGQGSFEKILAGKAE